jgi:hypothetical protein
MSHFIYRYAECRYAESLCLCHYAECRYAECRGATICIFTKTNVLLTASNLILVLHRDALLIKILISTCEILHFKITQALVGGVGGRSVTKLL